MSGGKGSFGGFGGAGQPGFISPFDMQAVQNAATNALQTTNARYQQLGLGATGATPSGANTPQLGGPTGFAGGGGSSGGGGASGGWNPGSGSTPVNAGNFGAGPTAFEMDVGNAPSQTGGIPAEAQALLGQIQTQDLNTGATQGGSSGKGK